MLKQIIFLQIFKGCLAQILLAPFLKTLSHMKIRLNNGFYNGNSRNSHQKCSMERAVLKDFAIFKENTFVGISLLKKDSNTGVFSFDYYDIFNNTYFEEHRQMAPSDKAYST